MKRWQKWTLGAGVGALATYILWRLWPKGQEQPGEETPPTYAPDYYTPTQPYEGGQPTPVVPTTPDQSCPPGTIWDPMLPGCVSSTPPPSTKTNVPVTSTTCPQGTVMDPLTGACVADVDGDGYPDATSVPITAAPRDPNAAGDPQPVTRSSVTTCPPGTYFSNVTGACEVLVVE